MTGQGGKVNWFRRKLIEIPCPEARHRKCKNTRDYSAYKKHFIDLHAAHQDYHLISAKAEQNFPGQHAHELNDVLHKRIVADAGRHAIACRTGIAAQPSQGRTDYRSFTEPQALSNTYW